MCWTWIISFFYSQKCAGFLRLFRRETEGIHVSLKVISYLAHIGMNSLEHDALQQNRKEKGGLQTAPQASWEQDCCSSVFAPA